MEFNNLKQGERKFLELNCELLDLTIIKEMGHARVPALTDIEHDWVMKQIGKN